MTRYKLASMFVPATKDLYNNTKITMVIFAVFAILILVSWAPRAMCQLGCLLRDSDLCVRLHLHVELWQRAHPGSSCVK